MHLPLTWWFLLGVICPLSPQGTMFGDMFGCHAEGQVLLALSE